MMMNLTGSSSGVTVADLIRLKNNGAPTYVLSAVAHGKVPPKQAETLIVNNTLQASKSLTPTAELNTISNWYQERLEEKERLKEKESADSLFQFADKDTSKNEELPLDATTPSTVLKKAPKVSKAVVSEIDAKLETMATLGESEPLKISMDNESDMPDSMPDSVLDVNQPSRTPQVKSVFANPKNVNQNDTTRLLGGTQTAVSRILKTGGDSTVSNSPVENAYKELGSSLPPELIQAARAESKSATAQAILKNPGQFVDATTATTASIDNL